MSRPVMHASSPSSTVASQTLAGEQEVLKRVVWHLLATDPNAEDIVRLIEYSFEQLTPRDTTPDFRLGALAALADLREVLDLPPATESDKG